MRDQARRRLPEATWDFLDAGAGQERTVAANETAWEALELRPRALVDVSEVKLGCELLGRPLATPILLAPAGRQRALHPDGEEASVRAAEQLGTVFCLATSATVDLHDLGAPGARRWLQLYVSSERNLSRRVVQQAAACGFERVLLTVDRPTAGVRSRSQRHGNLGPLPPGAAVTTHLGDGSTREHKPSEWDRSLTFTDLEEIAGYGLPLAVKGILRGEDARRCLDCGADAIVVSNHGGRQLDGTIATARVLDDVVQAVGGRAPVLVDGGIRSGAAVFTALALGAAAVLVGRPYLWGLAAGGREGVVEVVQTLSHELRHAMTLAGAPCVSAIDRSFVCREQ